MQIFENKWVSEKTTWLSPSLPSYLDNFSGVTALSVTLDPKIGSETAIFIIDRTPFANEIASFKPFILNLDVGMVPMPSGPIVYMLFWLRKPSGEGPFVTFENTLNPHNPLHMQPYWDLARQTHWHIFVLGAGNEELNWFEFENKFEVGPSFDKIVDVMPSYPCKNFDQAKVEFQSKFTMEDLFNLGNSEGVQPNQDHVETNRISRNTLCPCGSRKKFKHCCGQLRR